MTAGFVAAPMPDAANANTPGGVDESDCEDSSPTSALAIVEGNNSASEDEAAMSKMRGQVGQFDWPCPREYLLD